MANEEWGGGTKAVMAHVPEEMKARIEQLARENQRTVSKEIRRALTLYLRDLGEAPVGSK